jgi:hypothetical protein
MTEYVMAVTDIWHSMATFESHNSPADNTDAFVGTYPYMDTIDTDTSYVEAVTRTAFGGNFTGYTIPAWTAPGPIIGARLELQGKHGAATNQRVHFQWDGPTAWAHFNADWATHRVPNTWELLTEELLAADDVDAQLPLLAADLATGRVEVIASYDAFPYFLSALRLVIVTAGPNLTGQLLDDRVRFSG